jgi:hypothetical protein
MRKIRYNSVLCSDRNLILASNLKQITNKLQMNIVYALNVVDLIVKMSQIYTEVAFIDYSTIKCDKMLETFFSEYNDNCKNIIVIDDNNEMTQDVIDRLSLKKENVKKSCELEDYLQNIISVLTIQKCLPNNKFENINVSDIVNEELIRLKISTRYLGYSMIKECVLYCCYNNLRDFSLNTDVYPVVGSKFFSNCYNVERDIRTAISEGYIRMKNSPFDDLPTNKEMINYLIDRVFSRMINN